MHYRFFALIYYTENPINYKFNNLPTQTAFSEGLPVNNIFPSHRNLPLLREHHPRLRHPFVLRRAPLFLRHRLALIELRMAAHTQAHQRRIAGFDAHAAAHAGPAGDYAAQFPTVHHSNLGWCALPESERHQNAGTFAATCVFEAPRADRKRASDTTSGAPWKYPSGSPASISMSRTDNPI